MISVLSLLASAALIAVPVDTIDSAHSSKLSSRKPMELVELRLRELVGQQESWFVQNARYGRDARRIGNARPGDETAHFEVQVEILYAGKRGWSAIGSHPKAPGRTCVVYVGYRERLPILPRTHADGRSATLEGIPACDK